jgi:hypothetical protein
MDACDQASSATAAGPASTPRICHSLNPMQINKWSVTDTGCSRRCYLTCVCVHGILAESCPVHALRHFDGVHSHQPAAHTQQVSWEEVVAGAEQAHHIQTGDACGWVQLQSAPALAPPTTAAGGQSSSSLLPTQPTTIQQSLRCPYLSLGSGTYGSSPNSPSHSSWCKPSSSPLPTHPTPPTTPQLPSAALLSSLLTCPWGQPHTAPARLLPATATAAGVQPGAAATWAPAPPHPWVVATMASLCNIWLQPLPQPLPQQLANVCTHMHTRLPMQAIVGSYSFVTCL